MSELTYHLTRVSANKKTGPIPVTTTSAASCPRSCGLYECCYGKAGPLNMHWNKVTDGVRGVALGAFTEQLSSLPFGSLIRHNQVGDLPGKDEVLDEEDCLKLSTALTSRRKIPFTYTHYPRTEYNVEIWEKMLAQGFAVNASTETLKDADEAYAMGLPTTVVLPSTFKGRKTTTPNGVLVAGCPAQFSDDIQCANCGGSQGPLCTRIDRKFIVGFISHGTYKKKVDAVIATKEGGE
jgi:hypothetical protein